MKSNRQRRIEIKAKRVKKKMAKKQHLQSDVRFKTVAKSLLVNFECLAQNNSYDVPGFMARGFYQDQHFACKDCGVPQIWTATQQKWWYEAVQGDVWTTAIRCRPCRKVESARKALARRNHLQGLAFKKGSSNEAKEV